MAGTVTVVCKLPNGLHIDMVDNSGDRRRVTLNGFSVPFGAFPQHVVGGAGLTHGVDADLFNAWLAAHADYEPVKNGLIFAQAKPEKAADAAVEREDEKSGLEGLDPANPAVGIKPATND